MRKNLFLTTFALLVLGFLVFPLVIVTITAFNTAPTISIPIQGVTLQWFVNAVTLKTFQDSFLLSVQLALFATLLALLAGIPAAYVLSRYSIKGKAILKNFFLSPTIIPGIVVGYSLYQFIYLKLRLPMYGGLLLGHFLVILPYIIRVVGSALEQFDFSIEEVAWSLGCNRVKAFVKVVLPNITSGIAAAFMLAFINSFNNIPVSMFLKGPGLSTLPTTLMNYIEYFYDPTVSAISVLLMALTIAMMYLVEKTLGIAAFTK